VAATILDLNSYPAPRVPLAVDLRQRLTTELAAHVMKLGRLLGRDLTHWIYAPAPSART
jgi:glycosyltransferase involved in cell wall biosynthesis